MAGGWKAAMLEIDLTTVETSIEQPAHYSLVKHSDLIEKWFKWFGILNKAYYWCENLKANKNCENLRRLSFLLSPSLIGTYTTRVCNCNCAGSCTSTIIQVTLGQIIMLNMYKDIMIADFPSIFVIYLSIIYEILENSNKNIFNNRFF